MLRPEASAILTVEHLGVVLRRPKSPPCSLVRDIGFEVGRGEIVCMVGESGSGKSLAAQATMGLIADEPNLEVKGRISFEGNSLLELGARDQRALRGTKMTMVFQEPMSSLDPVMRVGAQVLEAVRRVEHDSRRAGRARVLELFASVGLPDPDRVFASYPHQLSGGMCQRVMIAMALAPRPSLVIADEPTTALDVTVQAQILDLLLGLRDTEGTSILLITHDMAVAASVADRIVVVYAGRTVEICTTKELFADARHPYTAGLLRSLPRMASTAGKSDRLPSIAGNVPEPGHLPEGCAFAPRCEKADDGCRQHDPPLEDLRCGHSVACWMADRHV